MGRNATSLCILAALATSGCWKTELATPPVDAVAYAPAGLDVPDGWIVEAFEIPLPCPDRQRSTYYFVHPTDAVAPMPAAVLYHSGSFDYVFAPDPADPLAGAHFASPDRLGRDWSVRQVYTTLGLYPPTVADDPQTGSLPAALTRAGVAVLLPGNCWGDWWHNLQGTAENQFVDPNGDYFFRNGRGSAEWGYRFLVDPAFAASQLVTLPVAVDPARVFAVGLGEGGRAVAELLHVDGPDDDTAPDFAPAGVIVDSFAEDFGPWYADPARFSGTVAGLNRIFPDGQPEADATALAAATLPERTVYAFAESDPALPPGAHARMIDRMANQGLLWPFPGGAPFPLNHADPAVADAAVAYLLTGTEPTVTFTGTLDTGLP